MQHDELSHAAIGDDPHAAPEGGPVEEKGGGVMGPDEAEEAAPTFGALDLNGGLLESLEEIAFQSPTDVQWHAIPPAIAGHDLVVKSQTGSGKTAAFAIPLFQSRIDPGISAPQALVLCPTRELALQVAKEAETIGANSGIRTVAVYGGAPIGPQAQAFREGAQMLVGTPGRVLDHLRRRNLKPETIRTLVLDECDEMLSMGFLEDINTIIEQLPKRDQTLLFSATVPDEVERLAQRYLKDPIRIDRSADFVGAREIDHVYYLVTGGDRLADLLRVLEHERPGGALIFCNTRSQVARVAEYLSERGFSADGISSDLTQNDRERVMGKMREGGIQFLAATDVAARGIDLPELTHVINFTFPEAADIYVHRTGRTGRAGRSGTAVSLVSPREIGSFYYLRLIHKIYPEQRHLPSVGEVAAREEAELVAEIVSHYAAAPNRAGWDNDRVRSLARRLWSLPDGELLAGRATMGLLAILAGEAPAGAEAPRPSKAPRRQGDQAQRREARERAPSPSSERGGRDRPPRASSSEEGGAPKKKAAPSRPRRRPSRQGDEAFAFTTREGDVEEFELLDSPKEGGGSAVSDGASSAGYARLYLSAGRRHGVGVADLRALLTSRAGLEEALIADISLRDGHSFVSVEAEAADRLIEEIGGTDFGGRTLRVEHAKS